MSEKIVFGRIQHKHDTEVNWEKAVNFVPKIGELIVYDNDENYSKQRLKIGDGTTNVNLLPFVGVGERTYNGGEIFGDYSRNRAISKHSSSYGRNNQAGCKGYYWVDVEKIIKEDESVVFKYYLSDIQLGGSDSNLKVEYEVGDTISISGMYNTLIDVGVIESIDNNVISIVSEVLNNESEDSTYVNTPTEKPVQDTGTQQSMYPCDYAIWVLSKPDVGAADIGVGSIAMGADNIASGFSSVAQGYLNCAYATYSYVEGGPYNVAYGERSHIEGSANTTYQTCAHVEGYLNSGEGAYVHVEGSRNVASGYCSHAGGHGSIVSGRCSRVSGSGSQVLGDYAIAHGYYVQSIGKYSTSFGNSNYARGEASFVAGAYSTAYGNFSSAIGQNLVVRGDGAHAFGLNTEVNGNGAFAEGYYTKALNTRAHAEGCLTEASGTSSHAQNYYTKAVGSYSHAEGSHSVAQGNVSHAEGLYTRADGNYQHVQGKYNSLTRLGSYAHVVGNGTSETNRSNAHTLDWEGNAWFAGNITIGATNKQIRATYLGTYSPTDPEIEDFGDDGDVYIMYS